MTYVLTPPGLESVFPLGQVERLELPGAVDPVLRIIAANQELENEAPGISYLGRWPGASVATDSRQAFGAAPGPVTDEDAQEILASLRPATAEEWAAFVRSATDPERDASTLLVGSLMDLTQPIEGGALAASDLTLSPVVELLDCGVDPGMSNLVENESGDLCYRLDATSFNGTELYRAEAVLQEAWTVTVEARPDAVDRLNALFNACFEAEPICPANGAEGRGSVAIILEGVVISAPAVNGADLANEAFTISADLTEQEAGDLADAINAG